MTRRRAPVRRLPEAAGLQTDAVLLAGGLRAVLLQLAHPAVGHGVAAHSDFVHDPLHRLRGTLRFVYVVAGGEPDLVAAAARSVGRMHAPVVSGPGAPVAYDARDTALQLWVAATIHDTALRIAERVWGPLPAPLADELLARNGRIARVLGLPAEEWPADRAAFDRAYVQAERTLRFDAVTLEVARELLAARHAPWWARLLLPPLARATVPTLPVGPAEQLALLLRPGPGLLPAARRLAPAVRLLPAALRRLPARSILAAARREHAAGQAAVDGAPVPRRPRT